MGSLLFPLLGFLVGISASFTGLGGGFLLVPLLIARGLEARRAVATCFVAVLMIALSAVAGHARLHTVDWRVGVLLGLGGVVGAQIGPRLLQHVSGPTFNRIFAGVLVSLAAWMFFKK
ncbi:MAG TPA: sulfite exporter TauE/SafE family protein [Candidatus Sulfotelmatobacter sp.]|jgi:uncharacterized membrane protein YfcA|nr:sulfite exporter TauE/SafE family protein [Candidatus Sulfotelmatobacter sp.]